MHKNESTVIATCDFSRSEHAKYLFLTELFNGEIDISKFNAANDLNLRRELGRELSLLRLAGAVRIESETIRTTEFGAYLCLVLMKEFYTGMDKVRAAFRDDAKIKRAKQLIIMDESESAATGATKSEIAS